MKTQIFKNLEDFKDNAKGYSYSRLSTLSNSVRDLLKKDDPDKVSFRRGNLVDLLIENSERSIKEFNSTFIVVDKDVKEPSEPVQKVLKYILDDPTSSTTYFENSEIVLTYAENINYGKGKYTEQTILNKLMPKEAEDYFNFLVKCQGKIVVPTEEYENAKSIINTFKTHEFTENVMNIPRLQKEGWDIYFQVPFQFDYRKFNFKGIIDLMQVNESTKTVRLFDIKTTSDSLGSFYKSFFKYRYDIQASLYTKAIEAMFEGYTIEHLKFVYGSYKDIDNALIYDPVNYLKLSEDGFIRNNIPYKGWLELAEELDWHYEQDKMLFKKQIYDNNGIIIIEV